MEKRTTISLAEQVTCLKRELALRRRVYPNWITAGRMKPEHAEMEIAAMSAALDTLSALEELPPAADFNPLPNTLNEMVTPKQLWKIRALGVETSQDVEAVCLARFGHELEAISKRAASVLIDELQR